MSPTLEICYPGSVPYLTALSWQHQRLEQMLQDPSLADALLLLTHPPVYTLGQGADPSFLKFDPALSPVAVHRVERGGEVTYHGPGQWVAYPILNLRRHQMDLHWYLRQLEQVVIDALQKLDILGERIPGLTGVWVAGYKVAAIGIKVSRWMSFHGFAVNIAPDLAAFAAIVPCGIADRPVGSVTQFCPQVTMEDMRILLVQHFCQHFRLQPIEMAIDEWLSPQLRRSIR